MINVCCVTDDKPGHRSQLQGLLEALERFGEVRAEWLPLKRADTDLQPAHPPDLILCVGRTTHWPALKLRWRHGGRLITLSRSAWPLWLFDLCVLPAHDGVPQGRRVFNTLGGLNPVRPSDAKDWRRGLILVGGPSRHHDWDGDNLLRQLQQLLSLTPQLQWTLTTSRRTPGGFVAQLPQLQPQPEILPVERTDRAWLRQQYRQAGHIWVTEDSVSMVCESLSSGAVVGALEVPRRRHGRVSGNLDRMLAEGRVLDLAHLQRHGLPDAPAFAPLQEADRAALHILQWLRTNHR